MIPLRSGNPIMETLRNAKENGMTKEQAWEKWNIAFVCDPADEKLFYDFWLRLGTDLETNGYVSSTHHVVSYSSGNSYPCRCEIGHNHEGKDDPID